MSKSIFKKFEKNIDDSVSELKIFDLPIRVSLTALFCSINNLCCEEPMINGHSSRSDAGMDLISRASYLIPLLCRCPTKPEGTSAFEAFSAFAEKFSNELPFILQFAHFSEVAPYVHRNYYQIDGDERNINLSHVSEEHARTELVDIVLSQISIPVTINPIINLDRIFDKFAADLPKFNLEEHLKVYRLYFDWFENNRIENRLISEEAMQACISVSVSEFMRFQSAWLSIAEFHIQMIKAITRVLRDNPNNQRLFQEHLEWIAPVLSKDFLGGLVIALSGIKENKFVSLMDIFSFSPNKFEHGGEGFFPPIVVTDIGYAFSPYILKSMLSPRNILYSVLKKDQKKFDDFVSSLLEPQLLREAAALLKGFHNLKFICNSIWDSGEFDLLAYSPSENAALHIQAKAAIPPEGARMVSRAEDRVKEAVSQLLRFSQLEPAQRDDILSTAFGEKISGAQVVNCVLGWANFGSKSTWDILTRESIVPLNVTLLKLLRSRSTNLNLRDINRDVREIVEELIQQVEQKWEKSVLNLGDASLTLPLLKTDNRKLATYRARAESRFFECDDHS